MNDKTGGRPSIYPDTDKEKQALFDKIFECVKEGRSLTEIAIAIGIGRTTLSINKIANTSLGRKTAFVSPIRG